MQTYYIVSFQVWNSAIEAYVTRNSKPCLLDKAISRVNHLIDKYAYQTKDTLGITVDELKSGKRKLSSPVFKRWTASGFLVANVATHPIQGADPDAY
jgi:hypothetical protein